GDPRSRCAGHDARASAAPEGRRRHRHRHDGADRRSSRRSHDEGDRAAMLYAVLKLITVAIMRLLFRLRGRGSERVPRTGPVMLVSTHSGVLDPPMVGGLTPRPVTYMAKEELFRIPLFGALIRRLNARPVRREGGDPAALRMALRVLEDGGALLVFPEGT